MALRHGITISESATPIVPVKSVDSALPVFVGIAPVWKTDSHRLDAVNTPIVSYDYAEAMTWLGSSDDWDDYSLCEAAYVFHQLYGMAPAVYVNCFDPYGNASHRNVETNVTQVLAAGSLVLTNTTPVEAVLIDDVVVKSDDGNTTYNITDDYTIEYDDDYHVVITRVADGDIPLATSSLKIYYTTAKPSGVDADDIVTALNQVEQVYPQLQIMPGQLVAPKWSMNTTVAAAMVAVAENIDDSFRCVALVDISTASSGGADLYSEVAALKASNGWTDEHMICCWPLTTLGDLTFHMSTHVAGLMASTDYTNGSIPYVSPSNKALRIDGCVTAAGDAVYLSRAQANSLNEVGVVTAINWNGGWRLWGNWTAAFVGSTDPKDAQICVRRMFDFIGNTIATTFFSSVDSPLTRRTVQYIENSINDWLAGLAGTGALLAGSVHLLEADNPVSSLISGAVKFRVNITPVAAASDLEFVLSFDPSAYTVLWED